MSWCVESAVSGLRSSCINNCMKNSVSNDDSDDRRWMVEFAFRFNDACQRSVVEELGMLAHDVVRLWVDVITPGACVLEPARTPIRYVRFPTRSAARKFVRTWGGKLVTGGRS